MLTTCRFLLAISFAFSVSPGPAAADVESYAIVQDDATLKVGGHSIRLYGIYIPSTRRTCRTGIRPLRCRPEAALALEFRIQSFVRCVRVSRNRDRTINAVCYVNGVGSILAPDEDLSAYLLKKGLAVALPGAPFEYVTWERIAQAQGRGLWSDAMRRVR